MYIFLYLFIVRTYVSTWPDGSEKLCEQCGISGRFIRKGTKSRAVLATGNPRVQFRAPTRPDSAPNTTVSTVLYFSSRGFSPEPAPFWPRAK